MEKIAIDLLWLRPGKVGGTESFIRNLLDGFMELEDNFDFTLLVSHDNAASFQKYVSDKRYSMLEADVDSANIAKRVIWQNLYQNRFLRKNGLKYCFEPVYCKPWFNGGISYACVIHDLQVYHYPQYHPLHEVVYSRLCWRMDILNASKISTISNWVKKDIEEKYNKKDIDVIYNPILVKKKDTGYFYTVSQLIPHKNLDTLIKVMEQINLLSICLPQKLVISGVNGQDADILKKLIRDKGLDKDILMTGFISNEERNTLYMNCHTFLFPSIFEGFGMPPVEAMYFGARVVTTRCASIPEVTQGKAIYVDNPYDINEWIEKILNGKMKDGMSFEKYSPYKISKQYLDALKKLCDI